MKKLIYLLLLFCTLPLFSQGSIQISWNPSTDNVGVAGYNIWVDGALEATTSDTFYVLHFEPGEYVITVSAFDAAGNESEQSYPLVVTVGDYMPPTIPGNLRIDNIEPWSATLEWDESYDNYRLAGYNIFINDSLIGTSQLTYYDITGLTENTSYRFSVSSFDIAGNESSRSYELYATTEPIIEDNLELIIYPNPNHGQFRIVLQNGIIQDGSVIQIISMTGQIMYQRLLPYGLTSPYEEDLNLTDILENGTYVIRLIEPDNTQIGTTRLIIDQPRMYKL